MSDTTETVTTVADDRTPASHFVRLLFWLGPIAFMTALLVALWATTQYSTSVGGVVFAFALVIFGALSMLLWLVVCALDTTRPR